MNAVVVLLFLVGGPPAAGMPSQDPAVQIAETHHGVIVGKFNKFGQWNNAAKEFFLVDGFAGSARSRMLAFPSAGIYREVEKNDGNIVVMRVIPAVRGDETWYVVVDFDVVPEIRR